MIISDERFEKILAEEINISTKSFITSLQSNQKKYGHLTERQFNSFQKLENSFSPENKLRREQWKSEFLGSKKQTDFLICAHYYKTLKSYFYDLACKAIDDSDFIPSEQQYQLIVENKYGQKLIEEYYSIPKFKISDCVKLRTLQGEYSSKFKEYKNTVFIVIEVNSGKIENACKGAKKYRLLPIGKSFSIEMEERFLKKAKI